MSGAAKNPKRKQVPKPLGAAGCLVGFLISMLSILFAPGLFWSTQPSPLAVSAFLVGAAIGIWGFVVISRDDGRGTDASTE